MIILNVAVVGIISPTDSRFYLFLAVRKANGDTKMKIRYFCFLSFHIFPAVPTARRIAWLDHVSSPSMTLEFTWMLRNRVRLGKRWGWIMWQALKKCVSRFPILHIFCALFQWSSHVSALICCPSTITGDDEMLTFSVCDFLAFPRVRACSFHASSIYSLYCARAPLSITMKVSIKC